MVTVIVSSNLTIATLLRNWKKQITAIYPTWFAVFLLEMFYASSTGYSEADLNTDVYCLMDKSFFATGTQKYTTKN